MKNNIFTFFVRKFFKLITLLVALCIVTFIMLEKSPIDPVQAYVGADLTVTQEQRENIAEYLIFLFFIVFPPMLLFLSQ